MMLQLIANTREKESDTECEKKRESLESEGESKLGKDKWREGGMIEGFALKEGVVDTVKGGENVSGEKEEVV